VQQLEFFVLMFENSVGDERVMTDSVVRVGFLVREDFIVKYGGDTYQIEQYIENFSSSIVSEYLTTNNFSERCNRIDVFILINIDRFFDTVEFYRLLESSGNINKLVVIPIHHSLMAVNKFNKYRLGFYCPNIFWIEKMKGVVRALIKFDYKALKHVFINYYEVVRLILLQARSIIVISVGELKSIESSFNLNVANKSFLVRNGVSSQLQTLCKDLGVGQKRRDIDVLVCGRIEERKNQLNIIKSLAGTDMSVVFVGAKNKNNARYVDRFVEEISNHKNMSYVGAKSPMDLCRLYLRAKCHLSASFMEVSSLVDIEAYFLGCNVVSSQYGYTSELFSGDTIELVDPYNNEDIRIKAQRSVCKPEVCKADLLTQMNLTWCNASSLVEGVIRNEVSGIDSKLP